MFFNISSLASYLAHNYMITIYNVRISFFRSHTIHFISALMYRQNFSLRAIISHNKIANINILYHFNRPIKHQNWCISFLTLTGSVESLEHDEESVAALLEKVTESSRHVTAEQLSDSFRNDDVVSSVECRHLVDVVPFEFSDVVVWLEFHVRLDLNAKRVNSLLALGSDGELGHLRGDDASFFFDFAHRCRMGRFPLVESSAGKCQ